MVLQTDFLKSLKFLHFLENLSGLAPFTLTKTQLKFSIFDFIKSLLHFSLFICICTYFSFHNHELINFFALEKTFLVRLTFVLTNFYTLCMNPLNLMTFLVQHKKYFSVLRQISNAKQHFQLLNLSYNSFKFNTIISMLCVCLYASILITYFFMEILRCIMENKIVFGIYQYVSIIYTYSIKNTVFLQSIIIINEIKQCFIMNNNFLTTLKNERRQKIILKQIKSCNEIYDCLFEVVRNYDKFFFVFVLQRCLYSFLIICTCMFYILAYLKEKGVNFERLICTCGITIIYESTEIILILYWISSTIAVVYTFFFFIVEFTPYKAVYEYYCF